MLSESNRMKVSLRREAEENQAEAVAAAKNQKDIEYAEDGTKCVNSGPVCRVLDGLWRHGRRGSQAARRWSGFLAVVGAVPIVILQSERRSAQASDGFSPNANSILEVPVIPTGDSKRRHSRSNCRFRSGAS
jgi:hypothetical protein